MATDEASGKIHILSDTVSSRIAAGEVVERPAAVVKELIDNSLDAGSTLISIDVQNGGKQLIRVLDNGEGMTETDAKLACQRFATSKLRTELDLFSVQTFGFRGEALPSIASVSKFKLLTMKRGETVGTCVQIEGGTPVNVTSCAVASGTHIEVHTLFFNTPGRQKFLKSTATEFSHICHVVQQASLARPETHFRLTHNERAVLDYPSVQAKADRVRQLYGNKFLEQALSIHMTQADVRIEGLTMSPHFTRTSRTPQDLFVNSRPVKNPTIVHAVYDAYASFLPKGRHPTFVLFLDIDPTKLDVNVHPAKREVRFSQPDIIHAVVKDAIRQPLQQNGHMEGNALEEHQAITTAEETTQHPSSIHDNPRRDGHVAPETNRHLDDARLSYSMVSENRQLPLAPRVGEADLLYAHDQTSSIHVFGQVNKTYMIVQIGKALHILDQHTTHERVLFERLWKNWHTQQISTQALLIPEPIEVLPHAAVVLDKHLEELGKLGLEIERFGNTAFLIRAVPAMLGTMDYQRLVQDLLEDLAEWKSLTSLESQVRPVLASLACQGAVQAGRSMEDLEIQQVVKDWVQEGCPLTCPHGRRVSLRFSTDDLQRTFGRI
ncbi:MAG: DNA mismatch repair endonuclease MutL [Nitrospirales bacterium]|nr:DNA mismatch repair endonuclease MutL [Nitrospirales bacterium]